MIEINFVVKEAAILVATILSTHDLDYAFCVDNGEYRVRTGRESLDAIRDQIKIMKDVDALSGYGYIFSYRKSYIFNMKTNVSSEIFNRVYRAINSVTTVN